MEVNLNRKFTVKGLINCRYASDGTAITNDLGNVLIELWRKNPLDIIFLGSSTTNSLGEFKIEFEINSPNPIIEDGKINDVFIKAFYNSIQIEVDESIEAGDEIPYNNRNGVVWRNGSGIPDNNVGLNGDYYLNTASGSVYERLLGEYNMVANIKGINGRDGIDGRTVLSGTGPTSGDGSVGDFYINVSSHILFGPKGATAWPSTGTSLVGPAGSKGDTGLTGAAGAKGDKGDTGVTGSAGSKGDKGDTGFTGPPGATGDTGEAGTNGTDGSVWRNGIEDPDETTPGIHGDYYLNTISGDIFYKITTEEMYSLIGNMRGQAAPERRKGIELMFDKNSEYGSEDEPETGDIISPSGEAGHGTPGIVAVVIHHNIDMEPDFGSTFVRLKNSDSYSTDKINYITCTYRSHSLIIYKIEHT